MHGTPGMRTAALLLEHARRPTAAGSVTLGARSEGEPAAVGKLRDRCAGGSAAVLSDGRVSLYGKQIADTHGDLLHSRTPTRFFHEGVGAFRDLDLTSCYPKILCGMDDYLGRPVVLEPGSAGLTLKQAVAYVRRHADGPHAWFVKVSGPIQGFPNTLIPSTVDGLTNDNHRDRVSSRAARRACMEQLSSKHAALIRGRVNERKYSPLYTDEVRAGFVTHAASLMIRALPRKARAQYEALRAETIVFYPKKLVAGSGPEYDALVEKFRTGRPVDWRQELDLQGMTRTTVEDLDEKYVSLRYPVRELADFLIVLREQAGRGIALKSLANTLYGAVLPTSNPVAAIVITVTARAAACAMTMALNAYPVIIDGVICRMDQVPVGTFAHCLRRQPDYPLIRPEDGIRFLPADEVQDEGNDLTQWYIQHALHCFRVQDRPEYKALFSLHVISPKKVEGRTPFDGLLVDGSSNCAKRGRAPG